MRPPRQRQTATEAAIEQAYYVWASGKQISILDIGKVYAAGRAAAAAGEDVSEAVRAAVIVYTTDGRN